DFFWQAKCFCQTEDNFLETIFIVKCACCQVCLLEDWGLEDWGLEDWKKGRREDSYREARYAHRRFTRRTIPRAFPFFHPSTLPVIAG
ncbi:MAG: hypothetical protein WCI17_07245, partial [bacterium]